MLQQPPQQQRGAPMGNGRIQSPNASNEMGNMLGSIIMRSLNEDLPPPVNVPTGYNQKPAQQQPPYHPGQHQPPPQHHPMHLPGGGGVGSQSAAKRISSPSQQQHMMSQQVPKAALPTTKDLNLLMQARSYGHSPPIPPPSSQQMPLSNSQMSRSPPNMNKTNVLKPPGQPSMVKPR